jgi:histidyl-tRNA synthetase
MALIKKPVTGMKDILPQEMEIRDYCISVIKKTYGEFGFQSIETPCVENIENLTSKQGGDNEKLIFKILKRGEKLKLEEAQSEADLTDTGLRYDLTVPLVRYYSNHQNELTQPFKALQMGNVWRADRPQKGRFRQFMQCDIDIIGEPSNLAEIELILATTTTLGRLGFHGFQIRINERRILKAMAAYSGFPEERFDEVFIILDKMDKIGLEGVTEELTESGFTAESAEKYTALFTGLKEAAVSAGENATAAEQADAELAFLEGTLRGVIEPDVIPNLREIMNTVNGTKSADFSVVFDPTIVRGMSYYTGTIFEIAMPELGISCGGGGRYDKMVGRFTGQDVPACGFSIGFERIILILTEQGFRIPGRPEKTCYLIEKNLPEERLAEIIRKAQAARAEGKQILLARMNKNKKFQKEQLAAQGYEKFEEFYRDPRG